MKSILHRYLFREIAATFLFGLLVFTLVLFMGKILQLAELVFSNGISPRNILRLFIYLIPTFSLVTIPMSFLLAVLLAFARLSADNEITAMKSCGTSLYGLLPPVFVSALIACTLTSIITAYALPWGQVSMRRLMFDLLDATSSIQLREGVFNDQFPGLVIFAERANRQDSTMAGILIQDEREGHQPATIFAANGVIIREPDKRSVRIHLADGGIHQLVGELGYRLISFASYDVAINFEKPKERAVFDERNMSYQELLSSLKTPLTPKVRRDVLNEYHRRIALPFACFGFALLGVALGIQNRRSGRSGGFAFSIAIILCYYIILSASVTLSSRQLLPAWLAMWLPNIVFTSLGVWLFLTVAAERELPFIEQGTAILSRVTSRFPAREKQA